jgi:hypothetical protein
MNRIGRPGIRYALDSGGNGYEIVSMTFLCCGLLENDSLEF